MTEQESAPPAERLLDEFPEASREEWRAAAEALLKGAPFEKRLLTHTHEGLTLQPIYDASALQGVPHLASTPGEAPFLRGRTSTGYLEQGWEVAQELTVAEPSAFNRAALHDLAAGQTALTVVLDGAGATGLSVATLDDLDRALMGIDPTRVPVYLRGASAALPMMALFVALARRRGLDVSRLRGGVESDPLGALVAEGRRRGSLAGACDDLACMMSWAHHEAPALSTATVHGRPWSDGGAHAVQELAFVVATTAEYLREVTSRGVAVEEAAPRLRLSLTLGSNLFMEAAKIRAARLLYARVVQAFGGGPEVQTVPIHGCTAHFNRSLLDPWVNLLRGTTAAFSAVVGGVDSLHVGCHDELVRVPDDHSRRMARNIQLVLREEAHLTGVLDPAGGAWYVEELTDRVARAAWGLFQEIEGRGGMARAVLEGHPQAMVAATLEARRERAARRRDVQVGVNMYADAGEMPMRLQFHDPDPPRPLRRPEATTTGATGQERVASPEVSRRLAEIREADGPGVVDAVAAAASAGARLHELAGILRQGDEAATEAARVPQARLAQPFEALRRRVARHVEAGGERPRVFLAKLGPVAQHKARAEFITGFMEVAGFAVEGEAGFDTPEAAGRAGAASGAPVVAVCSTDDTYPELVPPLVQALRAAAPEVVVLLAGRPPGQLEALVHAGVDDFVYMGADAVELHTRLLDRLGIAP